MGRNKQRRPKAPRLATGLAAGLALGVLALPAGLEAQGDYEFDGTNYAPPTTSIPTVGDFVGDAGLAAAVVSGLGGTTGAPIISIFTNGPSLPTAADIPTAGARAHVNKITIDNYTYNIVGTGNTSSSNVGAVASIIGAFANGDGGTVNTAQADGLVSISNISLSAKNGDSGSTALAASYGFVSGVASGSAGGSALEAKAIAKGAVTIDKVAISATQTHSTGTSLALGQVTGVVSVTGRDTKGVDYDAVAEKAVSLTNITFSAITDDNDSPVTGRGSYSAGLVGGVMAVNGKAWAKDAVTVEASASAVVTKGAQAVNSAAVLTAIGVQGRLEARADGDVAVTAAATATGGTNNVATLRYGAAYGVMATNLINVGNGAKVQTISATGTNYAFALANTPSQNVSSLTTNINAPVILKARTTAPATELNSYSPADPDYLALVNQVGGVMGSGELYLPRPVKEAEYLGTTTDRNGGGALDELNFGFDGLMDNDESKLRVFGAETVNIGGPKTAAVNYDTELKLFSGSYFINQKDFNHAVGANYGQVTGLGPGHTDVNIRNGATLHIAGMIKKDLTVADGAHDSLFTTVTGGVRGFHLDSDYTLDLNVDGNSPAAERGTLAFSQLEVKDGVTNAAGNTVNNIADALAMFNVSDVNDRLDGTGTAGSLAANLAVGEIADVQAMGTGSTRSIKVLNTSGTALDLTDSPSTSGQKLFYNYAYRTGNDPAAGIAGGSQNDLYLQINRNSTSLAGLTRAHGASPNAARLAGSMAKYKVTDGYAYASDFDRWVTELANLEADQGRLFADTLNRAHGEVYASSLNVLNQYYKGLFGQFKFQAPGGGSLSMYPNYGEAPSAGYACESSWTARASVFGSWGSLDRDNRYFGADSDSVAGIFSLEKAFSEEFSLGLGVAVGSTDIDYDRYGAKSESDDLAVALYAGYRPGGGDFFVNARLGYGRASVDNRRRGVNDVVYKADYDIDYFQAALSAGYDFRFENNLTLTPSLTLAYLSADAGSVREKGNGLHRLWLQGEDSDSFEAIANLELAKIFPTSSGFIKLHGNLGLAHEFGDERTEMKSGFINAPNFAAWETRSSDIGSTRFLVGAGIEAQLNDYVAIALDYGGSFQSNYDNHSGQASFKFSW